MKEEKTWGEIIGTILVALLAWPLEAWFLTIGLSWLNEYWSWVPTLPFWGAMAATFLISVVGNTFKGSK